MTRKARKPRDFEVKDVRGKDHTCFRFNTREKLLPIQIWNECFSLYGAKKLHAWLGRAIKYLEEKEHE